MMHIEMSTYENINEPPILAIALKLFRATVCKVNELIVTKRTDQISFDLVLREKNCEERKKKNANNYG